MSNNMDVPAEIPPRVLVGTMEIRHVPYQVYLDTSSARFVASHLGEEVQAASWNELQATLAKMPRVLVDVPFTNRYGSHGSFTGIHANGNLLIRWDSGNKEQASGHYSEQVLERLTPEQVRELTALHREAEHARERLEAFQKAHTWETVHGESARKSVMKAARDAGNDVQESRG